ncbi:MAG: endo alpha-1,4 polygalactosaminidase [Anaerolineae bacterium]
MRRYPLVRLIPVFLFGIFLLVGCDQPRDEQIAGLILAAGAQIFSSQEAAVDPDTPRQAFAHIENYAVYYGQGQGEALAQFDAVIIQPETLETADLLTLTNSGTLALAYLSIGEVEPTRAWYTDGRVLPAWILGENPNWGSSYIDANAAGWQDLMVDVAGQYLAQGFNGIFLDTIDTVDVYPSIRPGMITLIQRLRETFPNAILVQNRGFSVMDETASLVDGIMIESLTTSYDFATTTYIPVPSGTYDDLIQQLQQLHQETGLVVLALDYAAPGDAETAQIARQAAQSYGFISAVSEITLQQVPSAE